MLFNNSLEKENIKLTYMNQMKVGLIAKRNGYTTDGLVNRILDVMTASGSLPVKDIRWLCKKRIDEIEKKIGSMTPEEALPYLDDLERYRFIDNILRKTDILKELLDEENVYDEDEDRNF